MLKNQSKTYFSPTPPSPKSNRCVHLKKKIVPSAFFCPIRILFFAIKSVIFRKITRFMARPVLREKKRNLRILSDVYIKKKSSRCVHQFVIFSFLQDTPSPKRIEGSPKRIFFYKYLSILILYQNISFTQIMENPIIHVIMTFIIILYKR